jgi:YcaO cyclodehydratase, ATP-ad Mg2+-binding
MATLKEQRVRGNLSIAGAPRIRSRRGALRYRYSGCLCITCACACLLQRRPLLGCHLDARIALQRALTEVNQLLDVAADAPPPWDDAKLSSKQSLYPAAGVGAVDASAWPSIEAGDLNDATGQCMSRLGAAGMEVLVVDKTRPDIGKPVVQVIVPGLCHFWPRFGAPRLYKHAFTRSASRQRASVKHLRVSVKPRYTR